MKLWKMIIPIALIWLLALRFAVIAPTQVYAASAATQSGISRNALFSTIRSGIPLTTATPALTPIPTATPMCAGPIDTLNLSVNPTTYRVGETVIVTATLRVARESQVGVGLLQYQLSMLPNSPPLVLSPAAPPSVSHPPAVSPGGSDTATFTFTATGTGTATVSAFVGFETGGLDYPVCPFYFSGTSSRPQTVSVVSAPPPPGVPEPGTWLLLSSGLVGLAGYVRLRQRS